MDEGTFGPEPKLNDPVYLHYRIVEDFGRMDSGEIDEDAIRMMQETCRNFLGENGPCRA